jgi:hypothetical protein
MPFELWNPRWGQSLRKTFLNKGGSSSVLQVLDDILPTVSMVDPADNEHHYVRGEKPVSRGGAIAAAAGWQYVTFINAANQTGAGNCLAIIERITVSGATGATPIYLNLSQPALLGSPTQVTDTRYSTLAGVSGNNPCLNFLEVQGGVVAPGVANLISVGYAPALGVMEEILIPTNAVVLSPSWALTLAAFITGIGFDYSMSGYIREMDSNESY